MQANDPGFYLDNEYTSPTEVLIAIREVRRELAQSADVRAGRAPAAAGTARAAGAAAGTAPSATAGAVAIARGVLIDLEDERARRQHLIDLELT